MSSRFLNRLRSLHARIDAQIAAERRSGSLDTVKIGRLKKFKLAIKDRLAGAEPLSA